MEDSKKCKILRNTLLNHQNELPPVRTKHFRVKEEKKRLEGEISRLESKIRLTYAASVALGGAARLHPVAGGIAVVAGKTEAAMRIAQLESEFKRSKSQLRQINSEISQFQKTIAFYKDSIQITKSEMQRESCRL